MSMQDEPRYTHQQLVWYRHIAKCTYQRKGNVPRLGHSWPVYLAMENQEYARGGDT